MIKGMAAIIRIKIIYLSESQSPWHLDNGIYSAAGEDPKSCNSRSVANGSVAARLGAWDGDKVPLINEPLSVVKSDVTELDGVAVVLDMEEDGLVVS